MAENQVSLPTEYFDAVKKIILECLDGFAEDYSEQVGDFSKQLEEMRGIIKEQEQRIDRLSKMVRPKKIAKPVVRRKEK